MKKNTIIICMAATILLSGLTGFGGAVLANLLLNPTGAASTLSKESNSAYQALGVVWDTAATLAAGLEVQTDNAGNPSVISPETGDAAQLAVNTPAANRTVMTIPEIAKAVSGSVVEIATERVVNSSRIGQYITSGAGSGVIITSNGYVVTNNHVIENASKITVRLKNGSEYSAVLIGRDIKTDLAVVKIEAGGLPAAVYGNSTNLVVGERAVAIGNPLGELGGTVTEGIISALNRDINIDGEMMNLLQTSAAVNPGNSGGGLFNEYGELIGVVNAKSGGTNIEGIGFAIPSNTVKSIADQLISYGYVQGRVDFGVTLVDISDMFTAMRYGVSSLGVYVGKTDEELGLQAGDRIISVNGTEVKTSEEVKAVYDKYKVGDKLTLVVSRGGRSYNTTVTLKQAKY